MYVTKKHLSRRAVLRGAGVGLALPFLDAMVPARRALAQTAAAAKPRMAFIYFPHGAIMDRWTPPTEGRDFALSPILEPLAPYKHLTTVVSGLGNKPAESPAVHAITPGTWLSCMHPAISHTPNMAITADQVAAEHIGADTPFPSLEFCTETSGFGACDRNYGCSYSGTISFRTPTRPLPMENNPRKIFHRLFGQGDTPEERARIASQTASLLDLVADEASTLRLDLGAHDRAMVDDYLQSVREVELQIQSLEQRDLSYLDLPETPIGVMDRFDDQMNIMFDLMTIAYQADLTRVVSLMMAGEGSNQTYNHIGVADAFHPLSHHQNDAGKKDRLVRIQTYHTEKIARWLDKLAALPDGEGTVLDNTLILYGSNMSNSNAHDNFPLPTSLIGGGWGRHKGGQHLRYPDHTPLANVLLTMLQMADVPLESFGDSTGAMVEV
jgi:hypothetical protein